MDSHAGRPFITPSQIVADPSNVPRKGGIDAHDSDEDTSVHKSWNTSTGRGEHDGETNGYQAHEEEDEGGPLAMAVRIVGTDDGHGCSGDVDGDGEELGGRGGVAEVPDDGREEERDSIQWGNDSPVHCDRL